MSIADQPSAARPLRLAIVDSDHRVRESMAALLESCDEIEVIGAVGHVSGTIDLVVDGSPDVVILDPRLPDVDEGLALIAELRRRWPGLRVLVMSWADGLEATCLELGADCFIRKSGDPNALVDAIRAAGPSDRRLSSPPADSLAATLPADAANGGSA